MNKRGLPRNLIASIDRQVAEARQMTAIGLPNFETQAQCICRNERMLRRFRKHGTPSHLNNRLQLLNCEGNWDEGSDRGVDGDWLASRRYRLMLLLQAFDLMKDHPGPLSFVTIAHPKWELPLGQLKNANIDAAKQWLGRRLKTLPVPVMVVGSYEASISVELNGEIFWTPHLHFVISGADKEELKTVLKIKKRYLKRRHSKPLTVLPINNLAKRLGYSTKRVVKRGVAYVGENGRQQRNKLPLILSEQMEFDAWLLDLPSGSRTMLFGCRIHHETLVETRQLVLT